MLTKYIMHSILLLLLSVFANLNMKVKKVVPSHVADMGQNYAIICSSSDSQVQSTLFKSNGLAVNRGFLSRLNSSGG